MQKYIIAIILALLWQSSFAETCPSINSIKKNTLTGWRMYDSDSGELLTAARVDDFKKNVEQFVLAEWSNEHNKTNAIHCYYRDNDGSDLQAYLSKDNFKPSNAKKYWYEVTGSLQCAAGSANCAFEKNVLKDTQLAKK